MTKTDRRIRRTQKLLGDALIALALERGYENITIQDVTARADIGYRSYFRHYAGLDDLLRHVAQTQLDELEKLFRFPAFETLPQDLFAYSMENGRILFDYIQAHEPIFRVLLLQDSVRFCLQSVIRHARDYAERFFNQFPSENIAPSIVANHVIYATFALMHWWLENDKPYSPQRMGEVFAALVMRPAWQLSLE